MKIKLSSHMAGDNGNHHAGKEVDVPVNVARQLVARGHAVALEPMPEPTEDERFPDDMTPAGRGKRKPAGGGETK